MTVGRVHELLLEHVRSGGSDLYITGEQEPRTTTTTGHGVVGPPVPSNAVLELLDAEATPTQRSRFDRSGCVALTLALGGARLRAVFFRTATGVAANIHRLPDRLPDPVALGLPGALLELTEQPRGLVLVTGPQRSGKSTTLAAMIGHIVRSRDEHVVTVEEPTKFVLRSEHGPCTQLEIGRDVASHEEGLDLAIDLGPSVLVARDPPQSAIERVLAAAEAGVLVLASIAAHDVGALVDELTHALSPSCVAAALPTLERLLRGVVLQRLLPDAHGRGWHAAHEVHGPVAIRDRDRDAPLPWLHRLTPSMQAQLLQLVGDGRVAAEDALRVAPDRIAFLDELEALGHPRGPST
ncbi:ATPase, T2SS/T4P/T4SS family [Paraliomyxa miuraensis]|uniref:ATPase, T2SS/T4P/T4SS family n=1 Tax=Paraliomyxa miuraensis TaxID=376150 RepID=UPI0022590694|nr:ATPase, T2SS/T4P/T4SS family [Paraliomyxa miuraensis]MCX4241594.1 ATPase, T2SS/T4P/T4SS family [Paraliomyxa miuraensis]